jgi:hypothetical protein
MASVGLANSPGQSINAAVITPDPRLGKPASKCKSANVPASEDLAIVFLTDQRSPNRSPAPPTLHALPLLDFRGVAIWSSSVAATGSHFVVTLAGPKTGPAIRRARQFQNLAIGTVQGIVNKAENGEVWPVAEGPVAT